MDEMQLLAKFKKNSVHGAQSHLKFSKIFVRFYQVIVLLW